MSEGENVQKTDVPATIDSLQSDFSALGIRSGAGTRRWTIFEDIDLDSSDFEQIGKDFLESDSGSRVRRSRAGLANCQLIPQRALVDFSVNWLEENRGK